MWVDSGTLPVSGELGVPVEEAGSRSSMARVAVLAAAVLTVGLSLMLLVRRGVSCCEQCGEVVDRSASSCGHCGRPKVAS